MSNLLRRLSVNLERTWNSEDTSQRSAATMLTSNPSFNDFSMHIGQDVEHCHDMHNNPGQNGNVDSRRSFEKPSASLVVGSAPTGRPSPIMTKALKIPRTSVGQILNRADIVGTPRSSLESPASTGVTPRSFQDRLSEDVPETPRSPNSPNSPTGGRRRRSPKIDGLDYYEFCELIRSSSL